MSWWRTIFGAPAKSAPAARTAARGASAGAASGDVGAALTRLYGEQQPFHLGAAVAFAEGGPDPLDGVSIYWSEHGPHFHYVSFGMAEVMGAGFDSPRGAIVMPVASAVVTASPAP